MARKSLGEEMMDAVKAICFYLPFWAVPIIALVVGGGLYWASLQVVNVFASLTNGKTSSLPFFIGLAGFILSFFAGFTGWSQRRKRKALLTQTTSLEKLRDLSWREFEQLVGEAYRKSGYKVSEGSGRSPDGGIDLDMRSPAGERVLIQCKHWKKAKIGVPIVREMLGVLTREKADKVIITGTGEFTKEAIRWAEGQPIELIDGPTLLQRLSGVEWEMTPTQPAPDPIPEKETISPLSPEAPTTPSEEEKTCPRCGQELVLRTAKRGSNVGNQFWGCAEYPSCRFTKPVG